MLWPAVTRVPVAILVVAFIAITLTTGCALPPGMNAECVWPAEQNQTSAPEHIIADVRVAEELAIRYADAAGKLSAVWRTRLTTCTDDLLKTIANTHGVPYENVLAARARLSEPRFDAAAIAPMLLIFVAIAWAMVGWLTNRFDNDEPWISFTARSVVAIATGGVVVVLGWLSSAVVGMIQMGTTHASYRALRPTWIGEHTLILMIAASIGVWCLARIRAKGHRANDRRLLL